MAYRKDSRANILLVDDHPENLLALEAVLGLPNYNLVRARSGMEALRFLLKDDFSLILLDVAMPGLNGFETAALIRERPKCRNIPIIFITAVNRTEADAARGYAVGALDYIIKPFEPDMLRSKVAALVGTHPVRRRTDRAGSESKERARELETLERISGQRYKNLANAVPHIISIARPDGSIDFFNERWTTYTGLTFKESGGWGWKKAICPDDLAPFLDGWKTAVESRANYQTECRLRQQGGAYRWHLLMALPEKDEKGNVMAWLWTATDIDDQKRLEGSLRSLVAELEEKKSEAEAANRVKSRFVSNVSHELRTPLNAILGYTALLLDQHFGEVSPQQEEVLVSLRRNARDLTNLIENLLDLSRIEAGKIEIRSEPADLQQIISEVFEGLKHMLSQKKVVVRWKIDSGLPIIRSDPFRIRQILSNLLSNAFKFTEKGSVTFSAEGTAAPRGILISVKDSGIGMPKEALPTLFEPFKRVARRGGFHADGVGIGLTIVKESIELLGGTIKVQSQQGKGTTFTLFLPDRTEKGN
ncbi:MAG: response regulator [Nitrospirae bacterium]|nr:response regulator [Candidatus Manganitrophaceae bacterium]